MYLHSTCISDVPSREFSCEQFSLFTRRRRFNFMENLQEVRRLPLPLRLWTIVVWPPQRRMRCFHRQWVQRLHANAFISCSPACVGPSGPRCRNSPGWEMHEYIACDLIVTCDRLQSELQSSKYENRNFRYGSTRSTISVSFTISDLILDLSNS